MKVYQWELINAENHCIGHVTTGRKDKEIASNKIKARYRHNSCFIKLGKCIEKNMDTERMANTTMNEGGGRGVLNMLGCLEEHDKLT